MDEENIIHASIRAYRKRHKMMFWLLDNNSESLLSPEEGDVWEVILVKKVTKDDLQKRCSEKSAKKVNY